MPDLYSELIKLSESDVYPFHMPGHKRNLESTPLKGAFRCDITEIDGFDNLHDERGIILEAEKRASKLFGAKKSFFLINGSTAGVLSAVSAAVREGGKILAARGSHKSFYHAAYLRRLDIEYLPVKMIDKYGIYDGYTGDDIERALKKSEQLPDAVFITSPTYEGRCSDLRDIADVCHRYRIPLIVDAAHGAHFGLGCGMPKSAAEQGADISICSLHKTLPSMTQTAIIHLCGDMIEEEKLKRFLRIYQSSSPSYVLMSSIDLCIKEMTENAASFTEKLLSFRQRIQDGVKDLEHIQIPDLSVLQDPAKVLIYADSDKMTGQRLYDILREEYKLQLEMATEHCALGILSGWDRPEGIERLIESLCEIDRGLIGSSFLDDKKSIFEIPECRIPLYKAWDMDREEVALYEAEGRISAEFVNLYPPGIPLIVPGEVYGRDFFGMIDECLQEGLNVQGVTDGRTTMPGRRGVLCVKQK